MQGKLATLSLFTSLGTLLCCALPALLVALGLGAALAGLVNEMPALVWFSEHKDYFFVFSGLMLTSAGTMLWRARNLPCPADPDEAKACARLRKFSVWTWVISVLIYATGAFFAYVAQYLI